MNLKIILHLQVATKAKRIPTQKQILIWVKAALKKTHYKKKFELGLRIVNRAESARLNEKFRHKKGPTNVLSFPFVAPRGIESNYLGDLVICAPLVQQEAKAQNKALEAHWAHLTIHGVLHLLGYDHEKKQEATIMEKLETDILAQLDYSSPY